MGDNPDMANTADMIWAENIKIRSVRLDKMRHPVEGRRRSEQITADTSMAFVAKELFKVWLGTFMSQCCRRIITSAASSEMVSRERFYFVRCFTGEVYLPSWFLHKPHVPVRCWRFFDGTDVSYLLSSSSSRVSDWSSALYRHFIINMPRLLCVSRGWDQESSCEDSFKSEGTPERLAVLCMIVTIQVAV